MMKATRLFMILLLISAVTVSLAIAQAPPAGGQGPGAGAGAPGGGQGRGGGGGGGRGGGGRGGGGIAAPLVITSTAYADGGDIPAKYGGAMGVSPPLAWTGAPMTTQAFALIMHDTDVAIGGNPGDVLHWLVWDIPGTATGLAEALKAGDLPDGTRNGRAINNQNAYMGPQPPAPTTHHYIIELYALNAKLGLPPEATRDQFMAALAGKIVAKGTFVGKFKQ